MQACSTVTLILGSGDYAKLQGLLSPKAVSMVKESVKNYSTSEVRELGCTRDHIKFIQTRNIQMLVLKDKRYLDIDMHFLALKIYVEDTNSDSTCTRIMTEIGMRFTRRYNDDEPTDWVITKAKIIRHCVM